MATSPNYGWPEPDNTDLVKNGALAMRTLGNAIDTTMATMVPKSLVDAKGDIVTATANDTPARLAVGNNGETLVADSSTATGLRYQGHIEAGKNAIINGNFDFWQRGTSSGSAGYQTADRWYGNASNSTTFARESTTVPTGSTYCFKMTAGATAQMWIQQAIETLNAIQFAGQTITASAQVQASVSTGMSIKVFYSTSTDNPASGTWTEITATSGGTATATSGSFTTLSGVFAIPSTAKSILLQITTTSTVASGAIVYIGKAQFELGSVVTTFSRAGGTIQGELAACQRYYNVIGGVNNGFPTPTGYASASGQTLRFPMFLPVQMRTAPTITKNGTWAAGNADQTTLGGTYISTSGFSLSYNSNAAGQCYVIPDSTDDTLTISAEL